MAKRQLTFNAKIAANLFHFAHRKYHGCGLMLDIQSTEVRVTKPLSPQTLKYNLQLDND